MDTKKSQESGIESSTNDLLFYIQNNLSNLRSEMNNFNITDSCESVFHDKRNSTKLMCTSTNAENDTTNTNLKKSDSMHGVNQLKKEGLKESTRKLLLLLDRISCDTQSEQVDDVILTGYVSKPIQHHDDEEECSIYNRLTRKCQCLNNSFYNDFILQFNENVKHSTCDFGEIIKNMKIVKRFLYMGDGDTRNALLFLREGLTQSLISEKADILQGFVHADICNIFEDHSIVATFIIWPCKNKTSGDYMTQCWIAHISSKAVLHHVITNRSGVSTKKLQKRAKFTRVKPQMLIGILLYKIASTEEGRRYLNLNSKISSDIKHALKKHCAKLNKETVDTLNATRNLLEKHIAKHDNVICFSKRIGKGIETHTLLNLIKCRKKMTISEVALNLEMLNNFSKQKRGKLELNEDLPQLLLHLKDILRECDNGEINIAVTNILSNVISKTKIYDKIHVKNNKITVMSTATEPIQMKNQLIQMNGKMIKKQKYKEQDFSWDSLIIDKLKKTCEKTRKQIIIVPVD